MATSPNNSHPSGLNPDALAVADAAKLLAKVGGVPVSREMIEADVAAGAPTNPDGSEIRPCQLRRAATEKAASMKLDQNPRDEDGRGLRCRHCGCGHFRVIYTRRAWGGKVVRRRECRNCMHRFTTWERFIGEPA